MPVYNFSFKIERGSRTDTKVSVYETTVNTKEMKFKEGLVVTNSQLAIDIEKKIEEYIKTLA